MFKDGKKYTQARRNYIVDREFQLGVATAGATVVVVFGLLLAGAIFLLPNDGFLDGLRGDQVKSLLVGTHAAYYLLVAGWIVVGMILVTHRVAGPAMVLQRAVEAFKDGNYDARLNLRKRDYLKTLARSMGDLGAELERRDEAHERLRAAAIAAVESGDLDLLREEVRTEGRREAVPF